MELDTLLRMSCINLFQFLAYAIGHMEGVGGVRSWRWLAQDSRKMYKITKSRRIFILEGCVSTAYAGLAFFILPGFPEDAKFLTEDERTLLLARLKKERGDSEKVSMMDIDWLSILFNWKIWLTLVLSSWS